MGMMSDFGVHAWGGSGGRKERASPLPPDHLQLVKDVKG